MSIKPADISNGIHHFSFYTCSQHCLNQLYLYISEITFFHMYVCTETRAEGQTTFVKYQSVLDFGTVWVLRKNHVFEEHAACF